MTELLSPGKAITRRHTAAMEIIADLLPAERVRILCYVIGWLNDPDIDAAVEAAEASRLNRAEARRRFRSTV